MGARSQPHTLMKMQHRFSPKTHELANQPTGRGTCRIRRKYRDQGAPPIHNESIEKKANRKNKERSRRLMTEPTYQPLAGLERGEDAEIWITHRRARRRVRLRNRAASGSGDATRRVDWSAGGGGRVLSRPAVGARPPELGTAALVTRLVSRVTPTRTAGLWVRLTRCMPLHVTDRLVPREGVLLRRYYWQWRWVAGSVVITHVLATERCCSDFGDVAVGELAPTQDPWGHDRWALQDAGDARSHRSARLTCRCDRGGLRVEKDDGTTI